jgi:RecG-like helicase
LFGELPNDEIALLHWRLSSKEKDAVMQKFNVCLYWRTA